MVKHSETKGGDYPAEKRIQSLGRAGKSFTFRVNTSRVTMSSVCRPRGVVLCGWNCACARLCASTPERNAPRHPWLTTTNTFHAAILCRGHVKTKWGRTTRRARNTARHRANLNGGAANEIECNQPAPSLTRVLRKLHIFLPVISFPASSYCDHDILTITYNYACKEKYN